VPEPRIELGSPPWKEGILTTKLSGQHLVKMNGYKLFFICTSYRQKNLLGPRIELGTPRPQRSVLPLNHPSDGINERAITLRLIEPAIFVVWRKKLLGQEGIEPSLVGFVGPNGWESNPTFSFAKCTSHPSDD
jgi:hypothetical protein